MVWLTMKYRDSGFMFFFSDNGDELTINGGFHKWGIPKMAGLSGENPMKMDDLGVPLVYGNLQIWKSPK